MIWGFLDILLAFGGLSLTVFGLARGATLSVAETQTLGYNGLKSCISFGEQDLAVEVNLTDPETKKTKEYHTTFRLPEDVYDVMCDNKVSNISLISKDGILEIHLILKLQDEDTNYASLIVKDIKVYSDAPDLESEASDPIFLSKRGNEHENKTLSYESDHNKTIECNNNNQKFIFHSPRAQAAIVFSQVRLQPYSKFVRLDNGKGILCPSVFHPSESSKAHSEIFIPLILAVALTIVILLIVIGYFVHKKIEGMGYTTME